MEGAMRDSARCAFVGAAVTAAAMVLGLVGIGAAWGGDDRGEAGGPDRVPAKKKSASATKLAKSEEGSTKKYEPPKVDRGVGGFVIDVQTGKPLAAATVTAYKKPQKRGDKGEEAGTGAPDAERGGYAIALEEGDYVLECTADGYATVKGAIRVRKEGMVKGSFKLAKAPSEQAKRPNPQDPKFRQPVAQKRPVHAPVRQPAYKQQGPKTGPGPKAGPRPAPKPMPVGPPVYVKQGRPGDW